MRASTVLIATCGLALLAAACGGSPASHVAQLGSTTPKQGGTDPSRIDKYAAALAYSRCMRSHGIANLPDPTQDGGGIQISGSAPGIDRQSPAFESAQGSCRHLMPHGGQPTHADQKREFARMLHISQCVRARGVTGFPDPTLSSPADRAGYGEIMSNDGVWLAIPDSIDVRSPGFRQTAAACNLELS